MRDEVARCRIPGGCELVWYGHDAILELAEELKEKRDPVSAVSGREDGR
jgi:hypothetical protein